MKREDRGPVEETLDPADWESLRDLGHRMIDDMVDYTTSLRERAPWTHAPEAIMARFTGSVPLEPSPPEHVYQEFREYILPYPTGNIHPLFWGWVLGTGTLSAAMADMLASTMNIGASGGLSYHSANYVEYQVLLWFKELMGFPEEASGLLTSGCSAANLIGLATARNTKAPWNVRRDGLSGAGTRMVLYASEEAHSSIQKAVELLGLGSSALRRIPVNRRFQIRPDALRDAIAQDRRQGLLPFCVVGAAGTTNTGAIDDLEVLADICQEEELWLHVDGAFGAWAILTPQGKHLLAGMERADSLAFDLHKWMYLPYEIGCVLVRSERAHREAFSVTPEYLAHGEGTRGMTGEDLPWLADYGFQLSRSFRALKAWMSMKEHGVRRYGRLIQQNIDQARYLGEIIEATPELELVAPVLLNVVNFRYVGTGLDPRSLDELNGRIIVEIQERGIAVVSGSVVGGKRVLHVAHTNHRSRREDFEVLVREVVRIGDAIPPWTEGTTARSSC